MEIAKYAGVTTKSVRKGLIELRKVGLIQYQPGVSRKWEFKASEIRRVIPIPQPDRRLLEKREK